MGKRTGKVNARQHVESSFSWVQRNSHYRGSLSIFAFLLIALSLAGCGPKDDNGGSADSIDLVPVFSPSSAKALGARLIMPKLTSQADLFYALLAPPIFRFESTPSTGLRVGDTYTISVLGCQAKLLTSRDGNDIVFAGPMYETAAGGLPIRTGKIEVRYDPMASTFQCRTELLIADDTSGTNTGWPHFNCYVVNEIPRTALASDHSFVAKFYMTAFLGMATPLEFQWMDRGEFFSGPGDAGGWVVGYAGATFSDGGLDNVTLQNEDAFWDMTTLDGLAWPASIFEPVRDAVVAAHEALKTQSLDNGAPLLGYRIYGATGAIMANIAYNRVSTVSGSLYMSNADIAGSYLKDATGSGDLVFAVSSSDASKMAHSQANLDQLIKGFPASAWRARSALRTLFADWSY